MTAGVVEPYGSRFLRLLDNGVQLFDLANIYQQQNAAQSCRAAEMAHESSAQLLGATMSCHVASTYHCVSRRRVFLLSAVWSDLNRCVGGMLVSDGSQWPLLLVALLLHGSAVLTPVSSKRKFLYKHLCRAALACPFKVCEALGRSCRMSRTDTPRIHGSCRVAAAYANSLMRASATLAPNDIERGALPWAQPVFASAVYWCAREGARTQDSII